MKGWKFIKESKEKGYYVCLICNKISFTTKKSVLNHIRRFHKLKEGK